MYYESINLTKLQPCNILGLLLLSDELGLQLSITYVQKILMNHHDFIINNNVEIIESTYQKVSLDMLWDIVLQQICDNPDRLFKSAGFLTFNPSTLEIMLKRDDFYVDEIIIWENLLKWARCQYPAIQQDVRKWGNDDFVVMERRLNRFISSIRFYRISSKDFLLKVYPFKKLLPNDLINNIFAYHMVPNKKQNINIPPNRKQPVIVISQHFNIFTSWIEKKNDSYYNLRNNSYNFNLIYRASRDGNTAAAFHKKCDNKGPTIVIAKIANSEQIVGGYNPLDWKPVYSDNGYFKSTKDSFIFSFTNRYILQTAKVSYPNDAYQYSIYCCPGFAPTFGGGWDLYCPYNDNGDSCKSNISWTSIPRTYPKIDIPRSFDISDYEVFQVTS
jgi:hypothetical protein